MGGPRYIDATCHTMGRASDPIAQMDRGVESRPDLVALALVMEGRVALDDAVRVLMVRQKLDRQSATDAVVRAAAFASDEYGVRALDRQVGDAL